MSLTAGFKHEQINESLLFCFVVVYVVVHYVINDKMTQQITVEVTLLLNAKFHPIIFLYEKCLQIKF